MSLVSNPAILNGSLLGQQHGSPATTDMKSEDNHCHNHEYMQGIAQPDLKTDSEQYASTNYQVSGGSNSLSAVDANGDHAVEDDSPVIDIIINNVVCTFSTRCYLNLKKIALEGAHVEYRRENGMLNMKLRRPNTTATIWSSGKITCTGSTSEDEAKLAARRTARRLQKLGFNIRFSNYRVVNVLGTCSLPFGIKLNQFSEEHRENASYEPELHPGVTYRIKNPKATLKIFSTGSITVTAPSVLNVQLAIEHIYPLVVQHKMEKIHVHQKALASEKKFLKAGQNFVGYPVLGFRGDGDDDNDEDSDEDGLAIADDSLDSFHSDESQD